MFDDHLALLHRSGRRKRCWECGRCIGGGRNSPEWALVCLLVVIILNTKKTPQENPAAFCVESKLRVSEGSTQGDGRFHRL